MASAKGKTSFKAPIGSAAGSTAGSTAGSMSQDRTAFSESDSVINLKTTKLSPELREIFESIDLDGDGCVDASELMAALQTINVQQKTNRRLWWIVGLGTFVLLCCLVAIFGLSVAAMHLVKDTKVKPSSEGASVMRAKVGDGSAQQDTVRVGEILPFTPVAPFDAVPTLETVPANDPVIVSPDFAPEVADETTHIDEDTIIRMTCESELVEVGEETFEYQTEFMFEKTEDVAITMNDKQVPMSLLIVQPDGVTTTTVHARPTGGSTNTNNGVGSGGSDNRRPRAFKRANPNANADIMVMDLEASSDAKKVSRVCCNGASSRCAYASTVAHQKHTSFCSSIADGVVDCNVTSDFDPTAARGVNAVVGYRLSKEFIYLGAQPWVYLRDDKASWFVTMAYKTEAKILEPGALVQGNTKFVCPLSGDIYASFVAGPAPNYRLVWSKANGNSLNGHFVTMHTSQGYLSGTGTLFPNAMIDALQATNPTCLPGYRVALFSYYTNNKLRYGSGFFDLIDTTRYQTVLDNAGFTDLPLVTAVCQCVPASSVGARHAHEPMHRYRV
eukprot:Amastigsp_a342865_12.p1 type:complete len:558 gc:universal Amastigsp_a342865_12:1704-31(-)